MWCGDELDGARHLLYGVDEGRNESRDEALNVLVGNQCGGLCERLPRRLLDVDLCVPDGLGEDRDDLGHELRGLLGAADNELVEDDEAAGLDLPLVRGLDLVEQRGHDGGRGPGVHGGDVALDGVDRRVADGGHLVGEGLEEGGEEP